MFTLKMNKLNEFINAKLSELQLTSIYLGRVIQKIFAKKFVAESLLSVEPNLMLTKKLLFPYITLLSALTSIIAVKYFFGETQSQRLQKLQNRAARIILNMTNDVNHTIAPRALGWEPLKIERRKAKGKMMYKILNNMGPQSLTKLFSISNKSDKTEYHLRNWHIKKPMFTKAPY